MASISSRTQVTSAGLKTMRESLGLTVNWLAEQAGVGERTVRYWESGRNQVPDDVAATILRVESLVADEVQRALKTLQSQQLQPIILRRYVTDSDLWQAQSTFSQLPTTCHAAMLSRLSRELEARGFRVVIEYAG